ncbi:hypothetical protein SARC_00997 [Sphaeroforma arctica JP610]|uniref:Uncharacterized protein n=1 Tax=Sphaeroforma arctica JP610 TaxID=667725 RepID=A0A0L0GD86_9EUKA|nr:hypothetical protein SARC_00997 [Sphaeroforma arctica JP610]KNC86851.1 hypothetical protein SARC_00997 [Sphaeroforma arctica JP610]|eukprot:XP_014160753.1 hypothetical protein SARC_00997 [Sphaeroforma arctica JP610]
MTDHTNVGSEVDPEGEPTESKVDYVEKLLKGGDSEIDFFKLIEKLLKDGDSEMICVVEDYILSPDRPPRISEVLALADIIAIPGNGFGIAVFACVIDWLLRIFLDFIANYDVGDRVLARVIELERRVYEDPLILTEPSTPELAREGVSTFRA